jgi:hypothetical protein
MIAPEQGTKRPQTVSLADEEGVKQVLAGAVLGLWEVVNNLTRLRPSKQERFRVTIFSSARAQPGSWVYEEVKRVSGALAAMGCGIVTGGGPGLMQAANEGRRRSTLRSGTARLGSAWTCRSSRRSTRSWSRRLSTRRSSRACTILCVPARRITSLTW